MSSQRSINTYFWDDPWVQRCDPAQRYLYLYLLTNPLTNIAGVYEISPERIMRDTKLEEAELVAILGTFRAEQKVFRWKDWVVMRNWPKHQSKSPTVLKGIERVLIGLPADLLRFLTEIDYQYPQLGAIVALRLPQPNTVPIPSHTISTPYPTEGGQGIGTPPEAASGLVDNSEPDTLSHARCDTIPIPPDTVSHLTLPNLTKPNLTAGRVPSDEFEAAKNNGLERALAGLRRRMGEA